MRSCDSSRGCCPIEMCALAIVGGLAKDLNDDVAEVMQQYLRQQQQQQHSNRVAWNQALPSLNALLSAVASSSPTLSDVWLQHRQVSTRFPT